MSDEVSEQEVERPSEPGGVHETHASPAPLPTVDRPAEQRGYGSQSGTPIPVDTTARRHLKLWIALAIVAVLGMCAVVALVAALLVPALAPMMGDDSGVAYVPEAATWTEDGRFAVVQTQDAENLPMTVVIDTETGEIREEHGVFVASVEAGAPVLWLVRQTPDEWRERLTGEDPFYDWGRLDEPPSALVVWDLSEADSAPTDRAPARWRPVIGTAGWDAYLEVDVLRGVYPSRLLFNNTESSGEGHKARLPDDFGTFAFVGFSPTGEYVAVEETLQISDVVDSWEAAPPPEQGDEDTIPTERRLLIVRASDGEVTAEASLGQDNWGTKCVWDPSEDRVLWIEGGYAEDGEPLPIELAALSPDGTRDDAFSAWGIDPPDGWSELWNVQLVGTNADEKAVYLLGDGGSGSRILVADSRGVVDEGLLSGMSYAVGFHASSGFLELEQTWEADSCRTQAISYDSGGGSRTVLWSGPDIPIAASWED